MFITFEGVEGSGKTTQSENLYDFLTGELGLKKVHLTRQPGGTEFTKRIRQVLLELEEYNEGVDPHAELFLFLADRIHHNNKVLKPLLEDDYIVICDRYFDSTIAYQGYGRQLELGMVRRFNNFAVQGLLPDRTFFLDIKIEDGLARRGQVNRMDKEDIGFYKRVREGFIEAHKRNENRVRVMDGYKSIDELSHLINRDVNMRLKNQSILDEV